MYCWTCVNVCALMAAVRELCDSLSFPSSLSSSCQCNRYYLYYYPITMAFVLGFLIFLFLSICSLTIWSRRCTRQIHHRIRSIMSSREGSPRPRRRARRRDASTQSRRRRAAGSGSRDASPETLSRAVVEGNTEVPPPEEVGMQAAEEREGELRHRVREARD